jgi:hypothetical protein
MLCVQLGLFRGSRRATVLRILPAILVSNAKTMARNLATPSPLMVDFVTMQAASLCFQQITDDAEVDLFKVLIGQALERRQSVGNNHTFEEMACRWNEDRAKGSNCVHEKLSVASKNGLRIKLAKPQ